MSHRFKPYQGNTYGIEGHRLLVLGESHYGVPEKGDEALTNWVMNDWRALRRPHTVLTKTAQLLTGHGADIIRQNREYYFNGCIFYNYMQEYVGKKHNDFEGSFNAHLALFEQLILAHKPTHILGWGWRLGEGIIKAAGSSQCGTAIKRDDAIDGYKLTVEGFSCAMMFIPHPSARSSVNQDISSQRKLRLQTFLTSYDPIKESAYYAATTS